MGRARRQKNPDPFDFRRNKGIRVTLTSRDYRVVERLAALVDESNVEFLRKALMERIEREEVKARERDIEQERANKQAEEERGMTEAGAGPVSLVAKATKPAAPDMGLGPAAARCAYTLVDVEVRSIVYESFEIPDTVERASLVPGDMAKLVFEADGAGGHMAAVGGHMAGERMWVKIDSVDIATGRYMGVLSNQPVSSKELGLKMGDLVVFEPKHVAGIARSDVLMMGGGGSDSVDEPIKN